MVSIFTGLGAGFERGSGAMLGSAGLLGSGSIGRNNEQVSLNAATGNLLISQRDEFLVGRGPDAAIGRTYNSLGDMSDENGDNWRQSTDRRVYGLTGTVNSTGSSVKRVSGDGSEITYTWQTINLVAAYWTTDGAGAHDKLSYAGGVWTWTDGDTQATEKYAAHGVYGLTGTANAVGSTIKRVLADGTSSTYGWDAATSKYIVSSGTASTDNLTYAAGVWTWSNSGSPLTQVYSNNGASWRITEAADKISNKLAFTYSGANLTRVTTATGDYEEYVWSGGNIAQIVTSYTDGTLKTLTRTSYGYDTSNRLTTVTVDLTPGDNSVADGAAYVTTYTYDGTSKRVASIGQTDGSLVTFVYDTSGRITRLTQTSAAGQFRTTVIAYSAGSTTITDPLGKVTTLDYNSDGSLKKVTSPPAYTGATAQVLQFAYTGTGTGDVSSITDALGAVTAFTYDAAGNVLTSSDRLGNVVTRTYGSKNEVLTETRTGSDAASAGAAHTTRYVYDTNGLLRYRISAEGSVTEYRYNGYGQQTSLLEYVDQKFTASGSDSESYLNGWVLGLADRSAVMRTDTGYDARGNAVSTTTYESLSASGTVQGDPVAIQAGIGTAVSLQPNGLTRVTKTSGTTGWDADASSTVGASGDFVLQISPTQVFNSQMIGVSQNPSSSASYDSLQYAFYFNGGSVWRSNGGGAYSLGTTLAVGDNYWLVRTGTTISFLKGATLDAARSAGALYSVGGATGTFYFDCSLNSASTATDVKFTPAAGVSISSGVGTAVSLQPNGLTRVTKTSGTAGWDADASSTVGASGDFVLQISPTQVFNSQMIGVSQNPSSSASYDSLQYAFYFIGGNVWRSNGGGVYSLGTTLTVGDNFWLVRTGTTISYLKGATLEAARSAGALYSVDGAIGTFYFDCSLNSAGTVSDVAFMPVGTAEVTSRTSYTYDQAGQLLRRAGAGFNAETFVYDGLGRVIASVDLDGNNTSIAFNDAATQTVVTLGNGFTRTSVYNKAGELNSVSETGDNVTASAFYSYTDQMGRLRTDGPNSKYYLYDNLGRKVADIGRYTGDFTEYRYDANNRLVATIRYATALTSGQLASLGNHLVQIELSSIRPDSATADLWTWNVYDAEDRLVQAINGDGAVTTYQYDASDRLVGTTAFANKLSAVQLAALKTGSLAPAAAADAARDSIARNFYDKAGLLIGVLDGEGYLSQITYDNAGRKVRETAFATATDASLRASGTFLALVGSVTAAANPADRTVRYVYDAQGNLRFEVDGLNHVTEYVYTGGVQGSAVAVPRQTIKYAGTIATLADYRIATVKAAVAALASDANNRTSWTVLNGSGRAAYTIDATGAVISYRYDALGQVTKIVRFDTLRTTASLPDLATMDAWSVANIGAAANRITRNYYSARGELRYSVDGEGYVTRFIYDQYGRPTVSLRWDTPVVTTEDTTIATIATLPTGSGTTNSTAYDYLNRVVSRTDGAGVVTTYVYNANGTLGSTYQAYGTADQAQTVYTYDNAGQVLTRTDAYGTAEQTVTFYTYDGLGNILTVTDPTGSVTTSSYDRLGRLLTRTNALSGVVAYQYNGFGEAVKATDPRGSASYTYYDRLGRVISTRDADNYVTERAYTAFGELASVTRRYNKAIGTASDTTPPTPTPDAARDATVSFQYDRVGQVASKTDALGAVTTYGRNAFGDVVTEVDPLENGPATTIQTTRTYDKRGLLRTEVVDSAAGGKALTTSYGYDAFGRVLTLTDPANQVSSKVYDRSGLLVSSTDALNQTTSYSYDKRGNLAAVQDALGKITRYAYDKNDRLIYTVDALGGVTQKSYDNDGRVILSQSYASAISLTGLATVTTTAAIAAALAARVSPSGNDALTRSVYDADGRLRYTVDAANFLTEFVYDAAGNAIRSIAYSTAIASSPTYTMATIATQIAGMSAPALAAARTTRNVYTAEGKRSFTIDALGNVTAYSYDAQGNVVKQQRVAANYGTTGDPTDAAMTTWLASNGNTTNDRISRAIYDQAGRLRFEAIEYRLPSDPDPDPAPKSYVTQYTYDAQGNVRTKIRYADRYAVADATSLIVALGLVGATPPATAAVTEFKYDSAGRLIETTDPSGVRTVMTLNKLGQALTTAVAYGTADESVTSRTYDALGRVLTETRASGRSEAATRTFTYDSNGNLLTEQVGLNIITRTYDALGHVLTVAVSLDATTNAVTTNSYDAFGNLVKVIDPRGNAGYFFYDALGRLVLQIDPERYATETTYTFAGQTASVTRYAAKLGSEPVIGTKPVPASTPASDSVSTFTYDKLDRVTSTIQATDTSPANNIVESYGYNAFGDRITVVNKLGGTTTNSFDKRGLLTREVLQIDSSGATITNSYTYDARGNRLSAIEAGGLRTTTYTYDLLDQLKTKTVSGVPVANATFTGSTAQAMVESYVYDKRGNLVQVTDANNGKSFLFYDGLGRKTAEISRVGTLTTYKLDVNGNITAMQVYGTAVALPSTPGGTPPAGGADKRETLYNYDRNNRLTSTAIQDVQYSEYPNSLYLKADVINSTDYDAAGNVVRQTDGRGNSIYTYYDRLGRKVAQVDGERYLTVYAVDQNGNVIRETRYATRLGNAPAIGTVPAAPASSPDDRITDFAYDLAGRRVSETRLQVAASTVSGTVVTTTSVSAQIRYSYNGLGQILWKTEANLDYTRHEYDYLGRETRTTQTPFVDYRQTQVTPTTDITYNGLNQVLQTIQRGDGTTADRITTYTYDAGRLTGMTDPTGFSTSYYYDTAGQLVAQTYSRQKSNGSTETNGNFLSYDAAGREISRKTGVLNGSTWTFGDTTDEYYNGYGEIVAQGTNTGGVKANAQQFADYDKAGRVWRTNFKDGITKVYAYDKNGNATMLLQSAGTANLKSKESVEQIFADLSGVSVMFSVFDKRNQLIETFQQASNNIGANPIRPELIPDPTGHGVASFYADGDVVEKVSKVEVKDKPAVMPTESPESRNTATGGGVSFDVLIVRGWESNGAGDRGEFNLLADRTVFYGNGVVHVTIADSQGTRSLGDFTPANNLTNDAASVRFSSYLFVSGAVSFTLTQEVPGGQVVIAQKNMIVEMPEPGPDFEGATLRWSSEKAYPAPKLHFQNENANATVVQMFVRPAGSGGAYQKLTATQLKNSMGSNIAGWFTYDLTQPPFNGLPANSSWDIKYLAMDAAGKIYDSKQAVLSRNSSGNPVLDNVILVAVRGPGQAMLTNDSGRDWLILSGLPAAPVNMRYRPLGSSGGWSVPVGVNPAGYGQNGLAAVDVTGVGGPVEYWVELADGTKLHGTLTVGEQASTLTQYKDASREIILRPPPGQTVTRQQFRYFRDGAWSSWIPQSGGGNWTYNAKDLADFYSSRSYPIEYETYNIDTLVSRSEATLTFGYDSQSMSTFSGAPGMAAKVLFDPKQSGVAKIVLYWRDQGSTGTFTAVTIPKADGVFAWDVDKDHVRPLSGTRYLEYYYDAYAADNTILPTLNHADHAIGYLAIQSDRYADTTNNALVWRIDTAVASQYLVHRTQSFNAFGEIASETDGNGRITSFNYNTMGRLTGKISPQVDVTDESGVTTRQSPTEYYYYDQSGRLVGKRDANQKFFTQTLLAGSGQGGDTALTIGEFNPDNSQKAYGYDIFGDLRKITDGLGAVTNNTYDKAGRLIQVDHPVRAGGNSPGVRLVDYYSYDGLGQRIKHSNSVYGGTVAETTDYDVQGRVVSTVSFGGLATTYSYTWYSIASNLLGTTGLGNFGGWQTTTTNSAGLNSYENRGLFGQINWRQDFGGHSSLFTYDLAGHLVGQTGSTGQSISYTYYNNGYIASITDNTLRMRSTFQYDNEGNRTLETYNSTDASPIIYQNASVSYDELNRVVRFKDAKAEITYKYDANGNRREVKSIYNDGVDGTERTQDYWYKYDSMNRFVLTMGTLLGGNIVAGNAGVALTYDPAGNRKTATTAGSSEVETYTYTADGYLEDTIIAGVVRARRTNDALGRVTSYTQFAPDGAVSFTRALTYDRNNRVTDQTETDAANGNVITTIHNDYRAYVAGSGYTGLDQGVITHSSLVKSTVTTETVYSYEWWDEAKQLAIRVDPTDRSNPNTGQWASGFSRLSYDENGHLKQVVDTQANRVLSYRNDAYGQVLVREEKINDVLGARQLYYYFDGRRIGDVGNSGPSPSLIDYAQELALDRNAPRDKGGFRYGRPVESADFDQNFQPINASYPGPVAAMYTARNGDTLQSIARAAWGDANLWYLIADANGLTGNATLVAGQTLSIPNKVTNFHNTSETFRVYNPGEAIGDAMPTLPAAPTMPAPPPPKKNGCGIFGMILLVVIAVAVAAVAGPAIIGSPAVLGPGGAVVVNATGLTAILGGSAAAAGSIGAVGAAVIGGAIAGAGASIVSQGVGVALGIQDKFSWKGVALGALSGAVGGGVGSTFGKSVAFGSKFLTDVAKGVTTNVITQGISVATGLQKKFDWAGVAVAGAVSGAVGIANRTLANAKVGADAYKIDSNTARNVGFYANQALSGVAGSVAGGAVRSFVSGSSFGDNVLATLPDVVGSTIGSLVADGVARIGRSSGKMSPGEKAFLGEAKRSAKAVPAALANASGASSQQGDVDQPGKDIVVVARRQDRDLIGAMNTYQWGRYFAQYGQQTDESGERWALRQQQPASPPVAASRDSSVQAPSATFFGGVSRAFIQNFGALGTDEGRRAIASGLIGFARDVGLQVAPFGTVLDPTVTQRNAQRVLAFGIGTLELVPKLGMGAAQIIDGVTFGRNDLVGEGVFNTSLTTFEIVGLKGLGRGVNALTRAELVAAESGAVKFINPAELRWTQTSAGGSGRASIWRERLNPSGTYNAYPLEPIDVVRTADGLTTLDHTRAAIALEYGITNIPARVHLPGASLPTSMTGRFGPATTWGEAAAYRAANQRPPLPPTGTTTPPRLPRGN